MKIINQINCFNINMKFWTFLGIWPTQSYRFYTYYSKIFVAVFVILYDVLFTINFYFLPRHLDNFVEEMIFYFTELAVTSKVLTFVFMYDEIMKILETLESDGFQATTDDEMRIINKAKWFNIKCWRIVAAVSYTSDITHAFSPLITPVELKLPICSYSFLSEDFKNRYMYPIYVYQVVGMHFHMLYNVNIDTFFWGIMVYTIAQLDILDRRLINVTTIIKSDSERFISDENDNNIVSNLNESIIHFEKLSKFCSLIQQTFKVTLFVQFSMASCIICVCLFRFTLPAPVEYYIFLATYMFVMIIQIMVPCWFGTRIMDKKRKRNSSILGADIRKTWTITCGAFAVTAGCIRRRIISGVGNIVSNLLGFAVYNSNWTPETRRFKSNMRFFVERTSRPLTIIGWKMFPLSLKTFTSIMNSAYSFFTLLRHMQNKQ